MFLLFRFFMVTVWLMLMGIFSSFRVESVCTRLYRKYSLLSFYYQDDMLILPKELARNLSNISRLVLAKRIGSGIHIVDPLTGEVSSVCLSVFAFVFI